MRPVVGGTPGHQFVGAGNDPGTSMSALDGPKAPSAMARSTSVSMRVSDDMTGTIIRADGAPDA